MKKFDGIFICTDLDGTLLGSDGQVSPENLRAIEYFKSEGGSFTFITGRVPCTAGNLCERVRPNVPYGCINGGGIYDQFNGRYVWFSTLSPRALELLDYIENEMPDMGIQVNTAERIYFSRNNAAMERFRQVTGVPNMERHHRAIDETMAKVLFAHHDDDRIEMLMALLAKHPLASEFDFIRSEHDLYEILPKGNSKGNVMVRIVEHLGLDMSKTIAVGDYNNDVSMLRAASIGFAVSNACPAAKAAADRITVSNDEHALAKIIEELDTGMCF